MILCNMAYKKIPISKKKCPWILIFDTTYRTRFGKLLKNLIGTHRENSKKRFFPCVWSILITPTGERISLPCPAWYSKEYAKENDLTYKSQPQLAVLITRWLGERLSNLKINNDLVIVVDSAFNCSALWKLSIAHNGKNKNTWTIITSCSKNRCLGYSGLKSSRIQGAKVHEQFPRECVQKSTKINISECTGINVRSQRKLQFPQGSCFYRYANQQLRISEIGDSNVVMSYKLQQSDQHLHLASIKFLLCSNLEFSSEKIISYYAFRWEVETFFREQKSDLAFNDFQAWNPSSCYRFIDHLTLSFNFLEFYRIHLIETSDSIIVEDEQSLPYIRTRLLKETFRRQAFADQLHCLLDRIKTFYGIRRLRKALESLKIPFENFYFLNNFQ